MAGNREGGLKAAKTNKERHGADFYRRIGRTGGSKTPKSPRGFASNVVGKDGLTGLERAKAAGRKGGQISRRGIGGKTRKDKGVTRGPRTKVEEKPVRKFSLWPFGRDAK